MENHSYVERLGVLIDGLSQAERGALVDMFAQWSAPHLSRCVGGCGGRSRGCAGCRTRVTARGIEGGVEGVAEGWVLPACRTVYQENWIRRIGYLRTMLPHVTRRIIMPLRD